MSYRFRLPTGEEEELEDPQPVVDLVLQKGAEFWNIGSGDANIDRGSIYSPITLGLYFDGKDRFQLRHFVPGEHPAIALSPDAAGAEAEIHVGGTRMTLTSDTLLTRTDAASIVRHFCETGETHPDFQWRR